MNKTIVLTTKRLILRELIAENLPQLAEILQDKKVMYAYEHPFSDNEVLAWLDNQQRRYREDGVGLWAVISKETGALIGQCGLTFQVIEEKEVVEIGYLFRASVWGNGYAIEAAKACKNYAFEVLNIPIVYSIIRDINVASKQVALRNGMNYQKTISKYYYGLVMPHEVYYCANLAMK